MSDPHKANKVECEACGYRWLAVLPVAASDNNIQCPTCRQMSGRTVTVDEEWAPMFK